MQLVQFSELRSKKVKNAYIAGLKPQMKEFNIASSSILGMLAKPYAVNKLTIKPWAKPWYYTSQNTKAKSGKFVIEKNHL